MKEEIFEKTGADDPLQALKDFGAQWMNFFGGVQQMMAEHEQLRQRVAELEDENARLTEAAEQQKKCDEWASRVTYEGVVEQIAACEDAKERDEARKLIEPLLKRSQATQFRKDIKRRVKELNEEAASDTGAEPGVVPAVLKTEEAEELMGDLVEAGVLTEGWQPVGLSGSERALVAKAVCDRLDIKEVWQVFGQLWNEKPETLRSYLNKALDQKKSLAFQERLKNILG